MSQNKQGIDQDRKDLHRGVAVNFVGYLLKLAHPLTVAWATNLYGAKDWGVFVGAQAILLMLSKVFTFGLDKGVLWWIPRHSGGKSPNLTPILLFLSLVTLLASPLIAFGFAPLLVKWKDIPESLAALKIISFSLGPMVLTEVLLHMTMGKKKMEFQVAIRETLVPLTMIFSAVAFFYIPALTNYGLALSFLLSYLVGMVAAFFSFRKMFKSEDAFSFSMIPDAALMRFSIPLWTSEMLNSLLLRLDTFTVMAYLDMRQVGVYGVVMFFANSIRSIRRSFDPIVLAIVSEISSEKNTQRLKEGVNHATYLLTSTQLPIFVFLILFIADLLPLYGEGFAEGALPIIVLCGFWIVNGLLGLAGVVVLGYGKSNWSLYNNLIAMGAQALLLFFLVQPFGMLGAAISVGGGYTVQNVVQWIQVNKLTGSWLYKPSVLYPLGWAVLCALAGYFAGVGLGKVVAVPPLVAKGVVFLIFIGSYGSYFLLMKKKQKQNA